MDDTLKYTYVEYVGKPIERIEVPSGFQGSTFGVTLNKSYDEPGILLSIQDRTGFNEVILKVSHAHLLIKALEDIVSRGVPQ